jgi:hypothetical protein
VLRGARRAGNEEHPAPRSGVPTAVLTLAGKLTSWPSGRRQSADLRDPPGPVTELTASPGLEPGLVAPGCQRGRSQPASLLRSKRSRKDVMAAARWDWGMDSNSASKLTQCRDRQRYPKL